MYFQVSFILPLAIWLVLASMLNSVRQIEALGVHGQLNSWLPLYFCHLTFLLFPWEEHSFAARSRMRYVEKNLTRLTAENQFGPTHWIENKKNKHLSVINHKVWVLFAIYLEYIRNLTNIDILRLGLWWQCMTLLWDSTPFLSLSY